MIAILAGNHDQYRDWLYSVGRQDWASLNSVVRYVTMWRDVAGMTFTNYIIVGTFWNRPDAKKLYELTRTRIR